MYIWDDQFAYSDVFIIFMVYFLSYLFLLNCFSLQLIFYPLHGNPYYFES